MEILDIKDQDDGSCIMECNFSEIEVNFFLNYAVNDILKKQIGRMENEHRNDREVCSEETP